MLTYFDECAKSGKPPRIEGLTNALDVSRMKIRKVRKAVKTVSNVFFGYLPNDDSYNFHGKNGIYY